MSIQNELAAKVLGDIIAKGMSMSGTDLTDRVHTEAISALDSIRLVMYNSSLDEHGKLTAIQKVMESYNITEE